MRRVALRGLFARRMRLVLTSLAVALGVTLVAGTLIFSDTINRSFEQIFDETYGTTDVVLSPPDALGDAHGDLERRVLPQTLLGRVLATAGVGGAEGEVFDRGAILDRNGEPLGGFAPKFIASMSDNPRFEQFDVVEGRTPRDAGEAVIDRGTADKERFAVGDTIDVQGEAPRRSYEIVGIGKVGGVDSLGGAAVALLTLPEAMRQLGKDGFDQIAVAAAPGVKPAVLAARLRGVAGDGATVRTGDEEAADQAAQIRDDFGILQTALLAFAGIALFVGAFIIFNTFSITVAQRAREFALLRTLGASRRQVLRAVLAEGLVIGAVGSLVGVGLGTLVSGLLRTLFETPSLGTVVEPDTLAISFLTGTVVTVLAALAPALRATRVPPVAALREGVLPDDRGRRRFVLPAAMALTGAGVGFMVAGLFAIADDGAALAAVGAGAAATFLGVALLSPRLVKPLASAVGWPAQRLGGVAGRLARENSVRHPSRTAVTASALMIGMALVAFASIFAAAAKQYIDDTISTGTQAQAVVQNRDGYSAFSAQATAAIRATDGVERVAALRFSQTRTGGEKTDVTGVDPLTFGELFGVRWTEGSDATWRALGDDEVVISKDVAQERDLAIGGRVSMLSIVGERLTLRVIGIHDDRSPLLADYTIANDLLARAWGADDDAFVLVGFVAGANPRPAIDAALKRDYPSVEALSNEEFQDNQSGQIDQVLGLILGLLGLSVLVSLFGIVNTLVLSITERTRELGLLRAVGASRWLIRRMIAIEAVIVALIGSVLGLAMGVLLAVLVTRAIDDFTLVIPVGSLALLLVLGGVAGVLAAVLPARRAARLDVLAALAYE